jgi:hypothetical protein
MALYLQMLLNRGLGPNGPIISYDSFVLMSRAWIKASEFVPTASYGYGIAVDSLDGHTILRHTGGMASFTSAVQLDLDAGAGAFASINAQQGYRPVPVARYAVQLMAASAAGKPDPAPPEISDPMVVTNSAEYVGVYTSPEGQRVEISGNNALFASLNGQRIPLGHFEGDSFIAADPLLARSSFRFGRAKNETQKDKPGPVVELMHDSGWYTNSQERAEFLFIVNGKARLLKFTGADLFRFESE